MGGKAISAFGLHRDVVALLQLVQQRAVERPTHEAQTAWGCRAPGRSLALAAGAGKSEKWDGEEKSSAKSSSSETLSRQAFLSPWAIQSLGNAVKRVTHAEGSFKR